MGLFFKKQIASLIMHASGPCEAPPCSTSGIPISNHFQLLAFFPWLNVSWFICFWFTHWLCTMEDEDLAVFHHPPPPTHILSPDTSLYFPEIVLEHIWLNPCSVFSYYSSAYCDSFPLLCDFFCFFMRCLALLLK